MANDNAPLTREDLVNLHEFIHQARELGVFDSILDGMDLADKAWQETEDRLNAEIDRREQR